MISISLALCCSNQSTQICVVHIHSYLVHFFFTNLKGTAQGIFYKVIVLGFHGGSLVKNLPANQLLGREDALEKEMATHSSILAWEIPQIQSTGSQKTQTQLSNLAAATNSHHLA